MESPWPSPWPDLVFCFRSPTDICCLLLLVLLAFCFSLSPCLLNPIPVSFVFTRTVGVHACRALLRTQIINLLSSLLCFYRDPLRLPRSGGGIGRLCTYRYTVTTRMTSAVRWAAMRAILMFHNCEGQSHKTVSTDHNF